MFEQAKWIWHNNSAETDSYGEFKTEISCEKGDAVSVRISSASNYALYINGVFADSGQYGDYPHYKVYDELDVSRYIVDGVNHIAIVGWYCGVFPSCVQKNYRVLFLKCCKTVKLQRFLPKTHCAVKAGATSAEEMN